MARERLCKVCRGWHPLDAWPAECLKLPDRRVFSHFPTPMMNLDTMDPVKSMADGLYYDSKSAIRKGYRAKGLVEVGNEDVQPAPPPRLSKQEARKRTAEALKKAGVLDDLPA